MSVLKSPYLTRSSAGVLLMGSRQPMMSEPQRRFGRHPAVLGVESQTSFMPRNPRLLAFRANGSPDLWFRVDKEVLQRSYHRATMILQRLAFFFLVPLSSVRRWCRSPVLGIVLIEPQRLSGTGPTHPLSRRQLRLCGNRVRLISSS